MLSHILLWMWHNVIGGRGFLVPGNHERPHIHFAVSTTQRSCIAVSPVLWVRHILARLKCRSTVSIFPLKVLQ